MQRLAVANGPNIFQMLLVYIKCLRQQSCLWLMGLWFHAILQGWWHIIYASCHPTQPLYIAALLFEGQYTCYNMSAESWIHKKSSPTANHRIKPLIQVTSSESIDRRCQIHMYNRHTHTTAIFQVNLNYSSFHSVHPEVHLEQIKFCFAWSDIFSGTQRGLVILAKYSPDLDLLFTDSQFSQLSTLLNRGSQRLQVHWKRWAFRPHRNCHLDWRWGWMQAIRLLSKV